ncbi:Protein NETWORKED 4A [Camellia lanceoleosa]|uniref:Protein NETWORKED 4A n=1 Tax=Camellia lanceoleosa TaxID=1840588 RepID=A0ACC0J651_9ERIC|nr:Protein NETWORKED 4A [Camellia lanceoleosa]
MADMNGIESEKSHSWWWDSHISPKNSKWLAENLEEVDQSVKQMLKLIEEDGDSVAKKAEMNGENRPVLIAHVEGFHRLYKSLAERYDHLTGELRKNASSMFQIQNSMSHSGSGQDSSMATPDQKSGLHKLGQQAVGFDLFLSSAGSSDLSLKQGSESSSLASDSESESFDSSINKHSISHVTKKEKADNELEVQENKDSTALLKRITEYEDELKESNKMLQISEEAVARWKDLFKKSETVTAVLIGDLQDKLESAQTDLKMQEANLEMEKGRVLELQMEVVELETQVLDSNHRIGTLVEELEIARKKLEVSEEEIGTMKAGLCNEISEGTHQLQAQLELAQKDIAMLEAKLDSEKRLVLEMQERIVRHAADVSERDQEIKELNFALSNAQNTFSLDKAKLQSDISVLSEQLAVSEARVEESELRSKSMENEIRQCEVEKKEMKSSHEAQQNGLSSELEQLKADASERSELMEALNKKLDMLKLKYDMVVAEKDGFNAKVQTLIADMNSRDNQIKLLEEQRVELIAGSETAWELVDALRLRVGKLEKEVDMQRVVISDRAEEKREAIRQLCFSLEHYRNGYHELRQAFIGHKRHAVLAS